MKQQQYNNNLLVLTTVLRLVCEASRLFFAVSTLLEGRRLDDVLFRGLRDTG